MAYSFVCPICASDTFTQFSVLWDALVEEWGLTPEQRTYIDQQQGLRCDGCGSNLRSMTLADAILKRLNINLPFRDSCQNNSTLRDLRVLEINEAGSLSVYLQLLPKHEMVSYPEVDMQYLPFPDSSFDVVVHSDTLEHVPDGIRALRECRRVLVPEGFMACTIPIIPDRLTRHRNTSQPSYHGNKIDKRYDFLVYREYGGDFWREFFEAGFRNIIIYSIVYPASMAIVGYN